MDTPDFSALPKIVAAGAVGIALVAGALGYGINSCQQKRLAGETTTIITHRATATAADARAQHAADSVAFFLAGRQYELTRQLDENARHAESLPPVLLPAHPPQEQ